MRHPARIKFEKGKNELQNGARKEGGDHGADPDGTAEKSAAEKDRSPQKDLDESDRELAEAFSQADEQRIAGAAALGGGHIKKLPDRHQKQAGGDEKQADGEAFRFREGIEIVKELNEISGEKRVDDGAKADFFLQQKIDGKDDDADQRHGNAVIERKMERNAHPETIPGGKPEICPNGQMHAEGKNEKSENDFDPTENDVFPVQGLIFSCFFFLPTGDIFQRESGKDPIRKADRS